MLNVFNVRPFATSLLIKKTRIESKLNFNNHLDKILKTTNLNVHVLATIALYEYPQKEFTDEFFLQTLFNYCPLVWRCHSSLTNKIDHLHEKCFRMENVLHGKYFPEKTYLKND